MFYLSGAQVPVNMEGTGHLSKLSQKLKYFNVYMYTCHFYLNIDIFPDNRIKNSAPGT